MYTIVRFVEDNLLHLCKSAETKMVNSQADLMAMYGKNYYPAVEVLKGDKHSIEDLFRKLSRAEKRLGHLQKKMKKHASTQCEPESRSVECQIDFGKKDVGLQTETNESGVFKTNIENIYRTRTQYNSSESSDESPSPWLLTMPTEPSILPSGSPRRYFRGVRET